MVKHIYDTLLSITIILVLSTVFIAGNDFANGIVSGKYFWSYASMALSSVVAIPALVKHRNTMVFKLPDILLLLFCLTAVLITLNHTGRLTNKCLLLIFAAMFYYCLRISLQNKTIYTLCCLAFVITGLIEAIWGLRQLYGFTPSQHSLFKITGSFFNPGPYSGWLAMVFPMSFWYAVFNYFNHKKHKVTQNSHLSSFIVHRSSFITHLSPRLPSFITLNSSLLVLNSITVVCILLVLPAAMSRASWLAALGGCAFTGILYGTQNKTITDCYKKYRKTIILFSFVAFILLAISMTGLFLLKKNSASGRAFTWKIAIRTIKEHPMGVGLGHFGGAYGDEQAKYFASEAGAIWEKHVAEGVEYAFNEYLQICIETGIVSFLAFIAFVIRTLFIGIKNKNYIPAGSLVSLLIFAAMSYPFNVLPFVIAFMFLSALCLSDNLGQSEQTKHLYQKFAVWAFILIAPVTITLCSHKIYLSYEAYRQWKITQLLHDLEEYAKQYPYLQDNIVFCFGYAQSLSKSGKYEESNKIINNAIKISCDPMFYNIMGKNYHALKKYGLAEQCLKKAANIAPNRLYPHYLLAKLYHEMGLAKKMEKEINIVLTTTPKIDSKAIEEMKEELVKLRDER